MPRDKRDAGTDLTQWVSRRSAVDVGVSLQVAAHDQLSLIHRDVSEVY